jgi:hypothetical protein
MRVFGWTVGLAAALSAVPANAQWSQVEGGMRHDKSGLICPGDGVGFALKTQVATDTGFSCRYTLTCIAAPGCDTAVGFAAVTWNPAMDFAGQFRSLAAQQGLTLIDGGGPSWAGPPTLFAHAAEGQQSGEAGWWQFQPKGQSLNVAVFYNAPAEASAQALVWAALLANQ